jgi:hypothetical protein
LSGLWIFSRPSTPLLTTDSLLQTSARLLLKFEIKLMKRESHKMVLNLIDEYFDRLEIFIVGCCTYTEQNNII